MDISVYDRLLREALIPLGCFFNLEKPGL